jgi:hypothetical protein
MLIIIPNLVLTCQNLSVWVPVFFLRALSVQLAGKFHASFACISCFSGVAADFFAENSAIVAR